MSHLVNSNKHMVDVKVKLKTPGNEDKVDSIHIGYGVHPADTFEVVEPLPKGVKLVLTGSDPK